MLLIQENWDSIKGFGSKAVLGCSPVWGNNVPDELSNTLIDSNIHASGLVTANTVLSVLIKRTPLPFLFFSVKELVKRREIALLGFMLISLVAGLFVHERGFFFMALPMVVGLSWFYTGLEKKYKYLMLGGSVLFFAFNVQQLWSFIQFCLSAWG